MCLKTDLDQMALRLKESKPGGGFDQGGNKGGGGEGSSGARENVEAEKKEEGDVKSRDEEEDSFYKTLKMVKDAQRLELEEGRVEDGAMGLENIFGQLLQEGDMERST